MAYKGKVIFNPKTRHQITFLQSARDTNGQLLEMESVYFNNSKEPALHFHPFQVEEFTVLTGTLTVKLNDNLTKLKEGESVTISAGTRHAMWNDANDTTRVNWKVWPALDTEYLLETVYGLAADGKVDQNGLPLFLQRITTGNKFRNVLRLAKPSELIQKVLLAILLPLACISGYKATYKKYFE